MNVQSSSEVEINGYYFRAIGETYYRGCTRCGGSGHYSFNGYDSICYKCNNHPTERLGVHVGSYDDAVKDAARREKARLKRLDKKEQERLAKLAKRDAAWQALADAHPAVWELLSSILGVAIPYTDGMGNEEITERSTFLRSIADRLWTLDERALSDRQIEAVEKAIADRSAKAVVDASKPALEEGRYVFTGKVVSTKTVDGDYGTSYKMLVEDAEGRRVFGTIPSNIWDEVEFLGSYRKLVWNETDGVMSKLVGMELTFTATFEVSRDDKSFGFFKRPAKAAIVSE